MVNVLQSKYIDAIMNKRQEGFYTSLCDDYSQALKAKTQTRCSYMNERI
jgi:hypothetical protein